MKIRPVGAELFHADRRTDITKLVVAFRNVANAPRNVKPELYKHKHRCRVSDFTFLYS